MTEPFFAPSQYDALDLLVDEYTKGSQVLLETRQTIEDQGLLTYLVDGNSRLLSTDDMLSQYRSYMWHRALMLTDVLDFMPSILRDAWTKLVSTGDGRDMTPRLQLESGFITDLNSPIKFDGVPEFTEEGIRTTIGTLMCMRPKFLAAMVDGVFFNLSGEHITNRPEGFSKRFIINNVYNESSFGIDFPRYSKVSFFHDLRYVVGKLLQRDPIRFSNSSAGNSDAVIRSVINQVGYGKWCYIDGNAIKMRCYKKGTIHVELHPEITWQLNAILATKHPNAIPAKFTKKPEKMRQERNLINHVIDERVVQQLLGFRSQNHQISLTRTCDDKTILRELNTIMTLIGGVRLTHGSYFFDYDAGDVINSIISNRIVPDQKSHQFYPSPQSVIDVVCGVVDGIDGLSTVCEPSCGTGNILAALDERGYNVTGYEISPTFSKVASTRVPNACVITSDFLDVHDVWYDAVVMNPPFDQGRWLEHVIHATQISKHVVAVLPEGAQCDKVGVPYEVVGVVKNAFDDTSITVKIVHFTK